jgi:hypothetical protein
MIYIPSYIKIVSAIQKMIGGGCTGSMEIAEDYYSFFNIRKVG